MQRVGRALLALAFLFGSLPSEAAVTLLPPREMEGQVEQVKGLLADPASDPYRLHDQATAMFDQFQNTHHLPVDGIGQWEKPEQVNDAGQEATVSDLVNHMRGLVLREPPAPIANQQQVHKRLMEDYVALEDLAGKGAVRKADNGELPATSGTWPRAPLRARWTAP
jgi:hypothetical protein